MKQTIATNNYKGLGMLFMLAFIQTITWAQDNDGAASSTTVTRTTQSTNETWYASPWVWVVGAAVFILLLIALMRGKSSTSTVGHTDRVTVTKTTSSGDATV